jgi:hypothetical protein
MLLASCEIFAEDVDTRTTHLLLDIKHRIIGTPVGQPRDTDGWRAVRDDASAVLEYGTELITHDTGSHALDYIHMLLTIVTAHYLYIHMFSPLLGLIGRPMDTEYIIGVPTVHPVLSPSFNVTSAYPRVASSAYLITRASCTRPRLFYFFISAGCTSVSG